jgi:predicted  nucleic acid-binding Zn-ribbon protein
MFKPAHFVCVALAALPLAASCKSESHGHEHADTTVTQLDQLRDAVAATKTHNSSAAEALQAVVDKAAEDPKPAFATFEKEVKALESMVASADGKLQAARSQTAAYFADWEKQSTTITDPGIRKASDERRTRLSESFEKAGTAVQKARDELQPLLTGFKDARTYLGSDLTPDGVKAIKDTAKKLGKDTKSANEKLDDALKAIEKATEEFKVAKPPPPSSAEKSK